MEYARGVRACRDWFSSWLGEPVGVPIQSVCIWRRRFPNPLLHRHGSDGYPAADHGVLGWALGATGGTGSLRSDSRTISLRRLVARGTGVRHHHLLHGDSRILRYLSGRKRSRHAEWGAPMVGVRRDGSRKSPFLREYPREG